MPKKGKVVLISTVKPFYDQSKLTESILLAKDLRELYPPTCRNICLTLTDKSRQYSKNAKNAFFGEGLPLL